MLISNRGSFFIWQILFVTSCWLAYCSNIAHSADYPLTQWNRNRKWQLYLSHKIRTMYKYGGHSYFCCHASGLGTKALQICNCSAGYYKPCDSLCNISGSRQLQSLSSSGLSYDIECRLFLQFLPWSVFSDVITVQHLQCQASSQG